MFVSLGCFFWGVRFFCMCWIVFGYIHVFVCFLGKTIFSVHPPSLGREPSGSWVAFLGDPEPGMLLNGNDRETDPIFTKGNHAFAIFSRTPPSPPNKAPFLTRVRLLRASHFERFKSYHFGGPLFKTHPSHSGWLQTQFWTPQDAKRGSPKYAPLMERVVFWNMHLTRSPHMTHMNHLREIHAGHRGESGHRSRQDRIYTSALIFLSDAALAALFSLPLRFPARYPFSLSVVEHRWHWFQVGSRRPCHVLFQDGT